MTHIHSPYINNYMVKDSLERLILHRKNGRMHRFRLAAHSMEEAADWLEQYRHFWEAQFDSLNAYLEVTTEEEQDIDNL